MRTQSSKTTERKISIDELTIGMYVAALDVSWFKTPFLFHKRLIRQSEDIALLKEYGVRIVTINPNRGNDVPAPELRREVDHQEGPAATRDPNQGNDAPERKISRDVDPTECTPTILASKSGPLQEAKHTVDEQSHTPSYEAVRAVRAEATVAVQKIFEGVKSGRPIDGPATKVVVDKLLQTIIGSPNHLLHLLHMRHYDVNLCDRSVDICSLALCIGNEYGFNSSRLERLGVGALLHDIGQMRVPRNIIRRQGRLGPEERKLVEMHPALGVIIVSKTGEIHPESIHVIAEHHERCDGSGYPNHWRAPDISVMSQIVGISDVYDAMVSNRGGRIPLQPAQAVRQLYRAGETNQFDRKLIHGTVCFLGIYPVGSLVELTTGEHAVVVELNPAESLRPYVKLIRDHKGEPYVTPRV